MCISDEKTESSNFDSLIPITAALDNLAIFLSLSILGNKLFTLRWLKWSHLELKTLHSLWGCSWLLWRGPGFKLISPESNNSKLKQELEFLYWSLEIEKKNKVRVQTRSFYSIACVCRFIGKKVQLTTGFYTAINVWMVEVFHNIQH